MMAGRLAQDVGRTQEEHMNIDFAKVRDDLRRLRGEDGVGRLGLGSGHTK